MLARFLPPLKPLSTSISAAIRPLTTLILPGQGEGFHSAIYAHRKDQLVGVHVKNQDPNIYGFQVKNSTDLSAYFRKPSSGIVNPLDSKECVRGFLHSPLWEEFLTGLDPKLAANLDLKNYPYLFPAYNVALLSNEPSVQQRRSHAIGQNHFLLGFASSLFNSVSPFVPPCDTEEKIWNRIDRGGSVAAAFQECSNIAPTLKNGLLLYRLGYCDMRQLLKISYVVTELCSEEGALNEAKLGKLVENMPSSVEQKKKFQDYAAALNLINSYFPLVEADKVALFKLVSSQNRVQELSEAVACYGHAHYLHPLTHLKETRQAPIIRADIGK